MGLQKLLSNVYGRSDDAHGEMVVFVDREGTDVVLPSDIAQNVGLQKLLGIVQHTQRRRSWRSRGCLR